jgi:Ca-activated chloride channel homolog
LQGQIILSNQPFFETAQAMCYHFDVVSVKKVSSKLPATGAPIVNPAKIIRVALLIVLALSLFSNTRRDPLALSASPGVSTQDESKNQQPPRKRHQISSEDQEDQNVLKGTDAISVSVDLVLLQVLVTDTQGNVLTGLKPENFTIYEDNVKQEIVNFSPIESSITAVMLVEYSNNIRNFLSQIWNTMYVFARSLRPDDWVAVIGYDMRPTILCDFTKDRKELSDALTRFQYPATNYSNLSDALIDALDRTQEIEGKVAIVLLSTGLDTFSRHTYDEALEKCKQAHASIYAISLGQYYRLRLEAGSLLSNESRIDLLQADNRLRSFAELTGGAAYYPRFESELPSIFKNISQLLRSQYSIAYSSTNTTKDGKFRKIRVDTNVPLTDAKGKPLKLKVITRKGYKAAEN